MSVVAISCITFILIFSSSIIGLLVQRILPDSHLSDKSLDTLKASRGVVIFVAALTLGLLISAAKTSFDSKTDSIRLQSAKLVSLGRILNDFGPSAEDMRIPLRRYIEDQIDRMEKVFNKGASFDDVLKSVRIVSLRSIFSGLRPSNKEQEFLKSSALNLANETEELRWRVYEELGSHLQLPVFCVLIFWLMCIFFSLGIAAPMNYSIISGFVLSSLSMTGAIYLMLELDMPYNGLITVSIEPLKIALKVLNLTE